MAAGKICPRFLSERELPPTGMFFPSPSLPFPSLPPPRSPPPPKSRKVKNLGYDLKYKYCLTVYFKAGILGLVLPNTRHSETLPLWQPKAGDYLSSRLYFCIIKQGETTPDPIYSQACGASVSIAFTGEFLRGWEELPGGQGEHTGTPRHPAAPRVSLQAPPPPPPIYCHRRPPRGRCYFQSPELPPPR